MMLVRQRLDANAAHQASTLVHLPEEIWLAMCTFLRSADHTERNCVARCEEVIYCVPAGHVTYATAVPWWYMKTDQDVRDEMRAEMCDDDSGDSDSTYTY